MYCDVFLAPLRGLPVKEGLCFVNLVVARTSAPTVFVVVAASYVITTHWLTLATCSSPFRLIDIVYRNVSLAHREA